MEEIARQFYSSVEANKAAKRRQMTGAVLQQRFVMGATMRAGSLSSIWIAYDLVTKSYVAIKIEDESLDFQNPKSVLKEAEWIRYLQKANSIGVPKLYWYGTGDDCNMYAMEFLGPNMQSLASVTGGKMSLLATLQIGLQLTNILQKISLTGVIHRSITPENVLVGFTERARSTVYLVDYGSAQWFQGAVYRGGCGFVGAIRYASVASHFNVQQHPKDDLETVLYLMTYLRHGNLPWQGIYRVGDGDAIGMVIDDVDLKRDNARVMKWAISSTDLMNGFPPQIQKVHHYVRNLSFEKTVDFSMVASMFDEAIQMYCENPDAPFPWVDPATSNQYARLFKLPASVANMHIPDVDVSGIHQKTDEYGVSCGALPKPSGRNEMAANGNKADVRSLPHLQPDYELNKLARSLLPPGLTHQHILEALVDAEGQFAYISSQKLYKALQDLDVVDVTNFNKKKENIRKYLHVMVRRGMLDRLKNSYRLNLDPRSEPHVAAPEDEEEDVM